MNINDPTSNHSNQKDPKQFQKPSEKPIESAPLTPPPLSSPSDKQVYSTDFPQPSKVYTTESVDTAQISGQNQKSSTNYSQKERNNQKTQHDTFEDQSRDSFRNVRDSQKVEELYENKTSNKEQTIAYILLALGLFFLLFFNNLFGGLLIGMVAGYYFASEIVYYIRNINQVIRGQDQVRYVVLTALVLGFFIAAPGIFIGAAIVAAFKHVMFGPKDPSNRNDSYKI